jgi:hypothetical protein
MTRIFLFAINLLLAACMLVATPLVIALQAARALGSGSKVMRRKIKHRVLGCTRARRRVRSDLYPESTL